MPHLSPGNQHKMWCVHHTVQTILWAAPPWPLRPPGFGLSTERGLCSAVGVAPEGSRSEPGASGSARTPPPTPGYESMKEVPRRVNAHTPPLTLGPGQTSQVHQDHQSPWAALPIP